MGDNNPQQTKLRKMEAVTKMMDKLSMEKFPKPKEITILLLGETGVGKSTFINAIVNYLSFESMDAANGRPICLIPVNFTIADPKTKLPVRVKLGEQDMNENTANPTKSATQYPKCYRFQDDNIVLNIIDTPGVADTDGVDRDYSNMQNILDFISNYPEINAFCVLLKPNDARVDVIFKYCLYQLFTHLNKSAANNILFLFTNSRGCDFLPGDTGPALISILDQIRESPPNVDIPYTADTTYCFDSESFRYLVASIPPNNIEFKYKSSYIESWNRSVEECQRLFDYIKNLPPHKVIDTLSLNDAKQIIQLLTQPLADITKNIADNVKQCEAHRLVVKEYKGNIRDLDQKLYTPAVEIMFEQLDRPITVCSDGNCCTRVTTNDVTEIKYNRECHSPCYLEYSDGNIVANKGLLRCRAFNSYTVADCNPDGPKKSMLAKVGNKIMGVFTQSSECRECGHSYEKHLHLTYHTKAKVTKVADQEVGNQIRSAMLATEVKEIKIRRLDQRIAEMKAENETIVQSMSMFACFLANNALTPVNDAFEDYVRHLIASEQLVTTGAAADSADAVSRLEQVLKQYYNEKQLIIRELKGSARAGAQGSTITVEQINNGINKLCSLKHNGAYIRTMMEQQKQAKLKYHNDHHHVPCETPANTNYSMLRAFW